MDDKIEKIMDDQIEKINIVVNQTNYTRDEAIIKLSENNNDHMKVIRLYLGTKEIQVPIKSINQEIYKQLRKQIDISEFNNRI